MNWLRFTYEFRFMYFFLLALLFSFHWPTKQTTQCLMWYCRFRCGNGAFSGILNLNWKRYFLWHNLEFFSFDLPLNVCSVASLVMVCSYKIGIAFDNVRWHSRIKKLIVIQIGAYISLSIECATLNSASFMTPMYGIESNAFAAVTTYGLDVFFRSWIHRSNIGFQTAFSLCHKSRKTLRSLSLFLSLFQLLPWIQQHR